jgi:uncharacterized protein YraI
MRSIAIAVMILSALPAAAQSLRNESGANVTMRAGPAEWFPTVAILLPGTQVDRGRCEEGGAWCLVSTDEVFGWVEVRAMQVPGAADPGGAISVSSLPPPGTEPLPEAVTDAVPPAVTPPSAVPGAAAPMLLSTVEPVFNVTGGPVNLRAGPGTATDVVGQLEPGDGGLVDLCTASEAWCHITRPDGTTGWVKATLIGLRRL